MANLWRSWNSQEAKQIAAMNLLLDAPESQRKEELRKLQEEVGECTGIGPVRAENWLRGQFNMTCPSSIWPSQKLANDTVRMGAPTGASCQESGVN